MAPVNSRLPISLYRSCLRELPPILTRLGKLPETKEAAAHKFTEPHTRRLPLHNYLRLVIQVGGSNERTQGQPESTQVLRIQQMVRYLEFQRSYVELLERYNVGLLQGNQDKIRRAARRVGLDITE